VEFIGGAIRHRALWERRRDVAGPGGKWTFSFDQREADKEVVLARNDGVLGEKAHLQNVRLMVVPDTQPRRSNLRKGVPIAITP